MTYSQPSVAVDLQLLQPILQESTPNYASGAGLNPDPERDSVTTQFLRAMRDFLHDPSTKETYRSNPKDFTRKRCFPFPVMAVTILSEHAMAIQTRLDDIFLEGGFEGQERPPTASAFCQARVKIQPVFFQAWAEQAVQFFYESFPAEDLVGTWNGRYLWAVDTTKLNLPDTPETRACFSIQVNQYPGREVVQAQASFLYDLINEVPVDTVLGAIQAEKLFLVDHHAPYLNPRVIAVFDRGYADYAVAAATSATGADFVIRCPTSHSFKIVQDFVESGATDAIATLKVTPRQKKLAVERGWPLELQVRLVRVTLENGKFEVLMTSLLDRGTYPAEDFQELYDKRWGVETAFLRFKKDLAGEVFSSEKVQNIEQDFYAVVFLQTLETILDRKQDLEVRADSLERELKHEYRINKAEAYSALSNRLVSLLLSENDTLPEHLASYVAAAGLKKSEIRPNRKSSRPTLTDRQRMNYQMYIRKRRC